MYINFLNEPEVSKENTKYILYSTPNLAAKELLPAKTKNNPLLYPDKKILSECESFTNLSHNTNLIRIINRGIAKAAEMRRQARFQKEQSRLKREFNPEGRARLLQLYDKSRFGLRS